MGLNIGEGISKYITVRNATMKYQYSEKVVLADLIVSRKTGNFLTDRETGEAVMRDGVPVPERTFTKWEGHFCGNAFEAAKTLQNGQIIHITQGWMEKSQRTTKDGKKFFDVYVVVTDYELCDDIADEEAEVVDD